MKKLLTMLLCISLLLSGCGAADTQNDPGIWFDDLDPPENTRPNSPSPDPPVPQKDQVLMLYLVGSNLESESGLASYDIEEMMDSRFDEENLTVLVCAGGASYWWTDEISSDEYGVYEITRRDIKQVYTMKNENMADPKTLTEFLDFGYTTYGAFHYNLILWNHGGGAVLGFGLDENHPKDSLTIAEMDSALQKSKLISDGKRFEWVGFDACLMGMAEVAHMLSDYANYMIASEELEVGTGWDYSFLKTISDGDHSKGDTASEEIIRAYEDFYETQFKNTPDYTLSCLDLSKIGKVITGLEKLVDVAKGDLMEGSYSKIAKVRDQAKTFGRISESGIYDTVDLYDLCNRLMPLYPYEAKTLQKAVDDLVVCQTTNVQGAHGVAVYFPFENKEYASAWLQVYESTDFSPSYTAFLKDFTKTLSADQLAQWDIEEIVPEENESIPNTYFMQLTPEQCENFSRASFSVWQEEEDLPGSYVCWLISRDVTLSEDGKISSQYDGKRFYIGDTSGYSMPCFAQAIEQTESYVKYAIPALLTSWDAEDKPVFDLVYIHVRVDDAHPEGVFLGAYIESDADDSLLPTRKVIEIQEGMCISPFYYARSIVFREDGSLAPFSSWEVTSYFAREFRIAGDLTVALKASELDESFCFLFNVTDTQGNGYFTNPIYFEN